MMKRITSAHLRELSPPQQMRLRDGWEPQDGDFVAVGDHEEMIYYVNGIVKDESLPLLNVGELLELLETFLPEFTLRRGTDGWELTSGTMRQTAPELIDVLWTSVKSVWETMTA